MGADKLRPITLKLVLNKEDTEGNSHLAVVPSTPFFFYLKPKGI